LAKLGRYQDAISDYDVVISLDPANMHAYHNRCGCSGNLAALLLIRAQLNSLFNTALLPLLVLTSGVVLLVVAAFKLCSISSKQCSSAHEERWELGDTTAQQVQVLCQAVPCLLSAGPGVSPLTSWAILMLR
jgi:hypothetical protein